MSDSEYIAEWLLRLTGTDGSRSRPPESCGLLKEFVFPRYGLGYSQLNELLLLHGHERLTEWLFQYLVDGTPYLSPDGSCINTKEQFREGVLRFIRLAMLRSGSVFRGYKELAGMAFDRFEEVWLTTQPRDPAELMGRHEPVVPIKPIAKEDTWLLGYLSAAQLERRLHANPQDSRAQAFLGRRAEIIERGKENNTAYLVSDHMDVYIATSMRERHEFLAVYDTAQAIFSHDAVKELKLRYFDPTQAYCEDRIDKGLTESLMLKRCACTIYLVQETDTLGKDSELASTLAQGKPVIAYVPRLTAAEAELQVRRTIADLGFEMSASETQEYLLSHLRICAPELAWNKSDPESIEIHKWIEHPDSIDRDRAIALLARCLSKLNDRRAEMLSEKHPLGIQVHIETGVANGVLVVRSVDECARVLARIMLRGLEFEVCPLPATGTPRLWLLRESVTQCVYRAVTRDETLTNAFWAFYPSGA